MYRPAFLFLSLLAWVDASYAARLDKSFCTGVNSYVTAKREQKAATSFCSSFLHLSPVYTTKTVTATKVVTKDSVSNVTNTALSTVTATQAATVTTIVANNVLTTASSTVTAVATDLVTTTISDTVTTVATNVVVTTASSTFTVTQVVATTTVFTHTITQTDTETATTTSTTSTSTTTTVPLSGCPAPNLRKRSLGKKVVNPKPTCFSAYTDNAVISRACSCLSIPKQTSTKTVTVLATRTAINPVKHTVSQTSFITVTVTRTNTLTQTTNILSTQLAIATVTQTTTILGTQSVSATVTQTTNVLSTQAVSTTVTLSSTLTTSIATTTTSTSTTTTTQTTTVTATATMLSNFALLSSGSQQYGAIFDSVGGSGEGVYFNANDFDSATKFNFAGTQLYYNGQYINTYAASSGNYYVVVNRPYAQFGYPTQCTLGVGSGPSGSCPIECGIPDGSFYEPASGNDVDNYGGAWGFQGTTDRFTVYAVGST